MLDVNVIPVLIQVPLTEIVGNCGMVTVTETGKEVPAQLLAVSIAVLGVPPCHKIFTLDVPWPEVIVADHRCRLMLLLRCRSFQ